jgi:glycogen debranching enzyme
VTACEEDLVTSLGVRSLSPRAPSYSGRHRGGPADRDRAYHQGTVWPWLIGPYADAARRVGRDTTRLLDGLELHLSEFGLGSVSETADGDAPHAATGCPFQAWSVAELIRARAA